MILPGDNPYMLETLLSDPKLESLKKYLLMTKDSPGAIVEVGVYMGGSLYHLAIDSRDWGKVVIGYDTFSGLPDVDFHRDAKLKKGQFSNPQYYKLERFFLGLKLNHVRLVKGHFPDSSLKTPISFAHIDTDTYQSTYKSLYHIFERLTDNGIIVIDDYKWPETPGVEQAITHAMANFKGAYQILQKSNYQFVIRKLRNELNKT